MNAVHLHLLLNHLPVVGTVLGMFFVAFALMRRDGVLAKASLGFLALVGVFSVAVYLTGEPAQEAVEKLPGFSERLVDRHEDAALIATILTGVIGSFALVALVFYRRRPLPRLLTALMLVGAFGTAATMAYTANLGGQIRHSEIRGGIASPAVEEDRTPVAASDEH